VDNIDVIGYGLRLSADVAICDKLSQQPPSIWLRWEFGSML